MDERYDLVVIGAGPAGERGAAQAAYFGKRVAIIERQSAPGGAAVHTGTLPSKTLRETALFLSGYRQRDLFGVTVEVDPDLLVSQLLKRKDAVRDLETERAVGNLARHGIRIVHGEARLLDAHRVEVTTAEGAHELEAEVVLVVTGSHPHRPPGIPYEDADVHDADGILKIDHLPGSLTVLGGGVIGCEYACMFAAMGVVVHLVDPRPSLLPFLDPEMGERLATAMTSLGVRLHLERRHERVERTPDGLECRLTSGEELVTDAVLVASGRTGNTAGLNLEAVGVRTDDRGYVVVDGDYRTDVPSVYAAGDVIGFPALASVSMEQARVAVCHAFGFTYKRQVSDLLPYGVYTIPEVSCVGLSEAEAARRGVDVVAGRGHYRFNVRAQIVGDREGMVKLVFDRATRRLVGCHCIGEHASELVHLGQAVITLDGTVETFIEMVFNHPTLGEVFKYAAYDALATMGPPADAPAPSA
ncbi:MAG TPA: Si-specific NAD(P)(+) transhydrogenase [Actinomycetota bacterium]|nr:Si-specific NAD(P)(+) transhydrogenase [Actinomycetota bacterium]